MRKSAQRSGTVVTPITVKLTTNIEVAVTEKEDNNGQRTEDTSKDLPPVPVTENIV